MKNIKIAFIIDSLEIGGANILTVDVANFLCKNNFDVSFFSLSKFEIKGNSVVNLLDNNISVTTLDIYSKNFPERLFLLKKMLKEFEIIHSCLESSNFYITFLGIFKKMKQKLVITYHGIDAFHINDRILKDVLKKNLSMKHIFLMKYLQNYLFRFCNLIISVSEDTKTFLVEQRYVKKEKIKVIYHGINLNRFPSDRNYEMELSIKNQYGIKNNDFVIGYTGRLAYAKGLEMLIKKLSILSENSEIKLLLIGDGMLREELEQMIYKLNLKEKCFISGFVNNIQDYYNILNLFVLPSSSEGIPLTLLEAMYFGKITLSNNVGGIPEIIQDGYNGFLYKGENEFIEMINYIKQNYKRLGKIGKNARDTVITKFNFNENVKEVLNTIYHLK